LINEAIAKGGSGATVYSVDIDGWQCACKELAMDVNSQILTIDIHS